MLLFFLLRIFAWKKILAILDARKERIASELKSIEDAQAQINQLRAGYDAKLVAADVEARKRIQEGINEGKKLTEELKKSAHLESQRIIEKARSDIKYELVQAREELKEEIVKLTISAAENVIQEKLTEEEDGKIIREFIDKMEAIE